MNKYLDFLEYSCYFYGVALILLMLDILDKHHYIPLTTVHVEYNSNVLESEQNFFYFPLHKSSIAKYFVEVNNFSSNN